MATEKEIYISINGTKQAITSLEDLTKATEDLAKGFEDTGKAADKAAQEVEKVGGGSKIGNGFKRIGDLGKAAFNGIGVAIKATGIGLLVAIVAKLIEEFMKTDTAAKLLQGSMAVLGVIFEKIQEAINFLIEYGVKVFQDPPVAV
jgi:phage-related tail protein